MKAQIIIFATALIFGSITVFAQPTENIVIKDAQGVEYVQPVKGEYAEEELPAEVIDMIQVMRQEVLDKVFDISTLSRPEKEEPLPFDLQAVFKTAKK